jgi:peptidylprolyl isomerase
LKFILIAALIMSTAGSTLVTYGQRRNGKVNAGRRKRAGAVKPQPKTAEAANASAATTTPSGLIYIITKRSEGRQPHPGDTVVVNYTGLLGDGVKFDSSIDHGQPIKFKLGVGRVIKGWDEGIGKLRVGEQATLIIPPQLGYGERGAGGVIPPGATLIFIVELVSIEDAPASN